MRVRWNGLVRTNDQGRAAAGHGPSANQTGGDIRRVLPGAKRVGANIVQRSLNPLEFPALATDHSCGGRGLIASGVPNKASVVMSLKIETVPGKDKSGTFYTVTVTIDGEVRTSDTFKSKEDAQRFEALARRRFLGNQNA